MSFSPVGDLARQLLFKRHNSQLKTQLARLSQAMGSGRKSDLPAALRGNLKPLTGLEASLGRIAGWTFAAKGLDTKMEAMQTALGTMRKLGNDGVDAFLHAKLPSEVDLAAKQGAVLLEGLLAHLNTRVADDWVFSGVASDSHAVGTAQELLSALMPELAGLTTAEAVETRILQWMAAPTGFASAVYRGGDPAGAVTLSAQDQVAHGLTALDPGFTKLLAAAAMGAALDGGLFTGSADLRADLAARTAELFLSSAADSVYLAGRLGQVQTRVDGILIRNLAEKSALEIQRRDIDGADMEETAAELNATSLQLDLLYEMTARLSSLSLLNALR